MLISVLRRISLESVMKLYLIMVAFVLQPVFLGELPEYG